MINYNHIKIGGNLARVEVKLQGKVVGNIKPEGGGWAYFPKNSKTKGLTFPSVDEVKRSLAYDTTEDQTPAPKPAPVTFEERVRGDFYKNPLPYGPSAEAKAAYSVKEGEVYGQFMTDFRKWLAEQQVPTQYIDKVVARAWDNGHAHGFTEVLNVAYGLVDLFR